MSSTPGNAGQTATTKDAVPAETTRAGVRAAKVGRQEGSRAEGGHEGPRSAAESADPRGDRPTRLRALALGLKPVRDLVANPGRRRAARPAQCAPLAQRRRGTLISAAARPASARNCASRTWVACREGVGLSICPAVGPGIQWRADGRSASQSRRGGVPPTDELAGAGNSRNGINVQEEMAAREGG